MIDEVPTSWHKKKEPLGSFLVLMRLLDNFSDLDYLCIANHFKKVDAVFQVADV